MTPKGAIEVRAEKPSRRPMLTCLSDVVAQLVSWLWYPYIPLGKITLLEGDPGLGKTFLMLAIAAAITRGWPLLSQSGAPGDDLEPAAVLYMSAEDGLSDTLRPRLDAVGADVSRVHALTGYRSTGGDGKDIEGAVSLEDIPVIEQALEQTKAKLVIIDPLQAYLGAGVDMHRANEVRPLLSALGNLAEKHGCAIVCIRHLNKSVGGKALYAGLGSIDFTAAARSVLQVGEHEGERFLAHVKSSLAPNGKSIRYELRDGAVNWLGVSDVTAEELRQVYTPRTDDHEGALEAAETWLKSFLSDGAQPASKVESEAKREGISGATLKRAKKSLGVISERQSAEGEARGDGLWVWALPNTPRDEPLEHLEEKTVPDEDVQDDSRRSSQNSEHLGDMREGRQNVQGVQDAQPKPLDVAVPVEDF